jgi:hypothetical protein
MQRHDLTPSWGRWLELGDALGGRAVPDRSLASPVRGLCFVRRLDRRQQAGSSKAGAGGQGSCVSWLLSPAGLLMGRLRHAQKIVLVTVVLLLPLGFVAKGYVDIQRS